MGTARLVGGQAGLNREYFSKDQDRALPWSTWMTRSMSKSMWRNAPGADAARSASQSALARHTLATYPPDLLIEVPRNACRSLEYHRAEEVIEMCRDGRLIDARER